MLSLVEDADRRDRLCQLEETITHPRSVLNVDCLLDTVQALVADCDHPPLKRSKNIESFLNRCMYILITCCILQNLTFSRSVH